VIEVDILPGSREFVELLCLKSDSADPASAKVELSLAIDPRRPVRFPLAGGPYGEQRLAISVTCENADGVHEVLSVMIRSGVPSVDATKRVQQSPIYDIHPSEAPDPRDVLLRGLGGLWTPK
jgi:hypothetical protein